MHADLLASARASRDPNAERKIKSSKKNLDSSVMLGILIQTFGKPGWIRNALFQGLRNPRAMLSPYMFKRLVKDGRKVMNLRRSSK
jgi:hypothetical protein